MVERPQLLIDSYDEAIARSPAAKILLMTNDPASLVQAAKERFEEGEFNIVVGSPHPFFVEFLPPQASKGAGLKAVCDHLGVDLASVVAFGDGDNDKEMLEMAGMGVAMSNAKPLAKSAANIVLEVQYKRSSCFLVIVEFIVNPRFHLFCTCILSHNSVVDAVQWSNDEDGVALHLERMDRDGLFGPAPAIDTN